MRSPGLAELLPPPSGKTGWPWTEASEQLPEVMANGEPWPRVSIVTPSFNQGAFIEETIRSVLLQGYPNLEYIIVDGGSTDQSLEIIHKYENRLAYWVSEPDSGQSDAINKGFDRASGEIFGWLNSDDVYEPGSIQLMAKYFTSTPECSLLYGNGWYLNKDGQKSERCDWIRPFDRRLYLTSNFILQPAAFWRRGLWQRAGELDVSCHWAMDWDWFLRATALTRPHYLPADLACWRVRPEIKTKVGGQARRAEIAAISRKYGGVRQPTYIIYQLDRVAWWLAKYVGDSRAGRMVRYLTAPVRWLLKDKVWAGRHQS